MTLKAKNKRATEDQFDELHRILAKNDITGIGFDDTPLGKLADLMPKVDFDAVQKAVHR